jgi:16S rRNA (guanine527-N7)-methyltransferase
VTYNAIEEDMLKAILDDGLKGLALDLDAAVRDKLLAYVALLERWNRAYNLTAVREPAQMVTRHILDSLAVVPFVRGARIVDVGTGPGLPGIPLALALPGLHFALLDSNAKKTRFLIEACAQLGLGNVEVIQARAEQYRPTQPFDIVLSRAFASIADMLKNAGHLCAPGGVFLAMKGVYPEEELAELPPGYRVQRVEALRVPGLDAARHVVILTAG